MLSFRPLPMLGNPHVQTVLANLLPSERRPARVRLRVVALPDGDKIVLHETPPRVARSPAPILLLVHGLGGSHRSGYMVRLTRRLSDLGWRVFRMDLRGAGAGARLARRFYNAACSADVFAVVERLAGEFPDSPIAVAGFSLGGNIVLKFAGEYATSLPASVRAIAAVAPPIDLVRCSALISGYPFYDSFFVRHLTRQVADQLRHFTDLPRVTFPRGTTLKRFDDLYTAPRWGYADADDYYRRASALPWMPNIRVPTFLLAARDDPFVAVEPIETLPARAGVEVHIAAHGGHLGFLGADGQGGIHWAETQVTRWLQRQISA